MTPDEHIEAVRAATAVRAQAEADWRATIRAAARDRVPIRRIGDAAGVVHTRVFQLVSGRDKDK